MKPTWPIVAILATGTALAGTSGKIDLVGVVPGSCDVASSVGIVGLGNLQAGGSHRVEFDFSCNTPFDYEIASENGALVLSGDPLAQGAFRSALDYDIEVALPTDFGGGIAQTVSSGTIGPGGTPPTFDNSGDEVAIGKRGSLTLRWTAPPADDSTRPMLAGGYQDTLALTLLVRN